MRGSGHSRSAFTVVLAFQAAVAQLSYASMRKYLPIILSFLFLVYGCASLDPALLTDNQMKSAVRMAREKALSDKNELNEQDKLFITYNAPKLSYYILAGKDAQYSFVWDIDPSSRVVVSGQGNILTLEGATVKKVKIEK